LKDSKEVVERYLETNPGTNRQFSAAARARRGGWRFIAILLLIGAVVLGYRWLTGMPKQDDRTRPVA
jgi:hypothetical protein